MRKFGYFAAGLLIILLAALGLSACSSIGFPDTGSGKEQQEDQGADAVIGSGRQTLKIVSGSENQELEPILEEHHFELVDVEYVKEGGSWYLRAYIDKPGGITVDDCEVVNRALGDLLDEHDFIEDSYILEISSPGLGRPLKKERDFERSLGEEVEIRTYRMVNKEKEFRGILKAYDKDTVTIETEEGQEQVFERENIALIRLAFDFV